MKKLTLNRMRLCWLIAIPLLTSCNALLNKTPSPIHYYSLQVTSLTPQHQVTDNNKTLLPAITINVPKAAAGFESRHMLYTRNPNQIEYFARNEWVNTPAKMLQDSLVAALENTGQFSAVTPKISTVKNEYRLESQLLTLIQNFATKPSSVDFKIRITLIDHATNQVIANQLFSEQVLAESDTPAGGVEAANKAVNLALQKVGMFIGEALKNNKNKQ